MTQLLFTFLLLLAPMITWGATAPTDFKSFVGLLLNLINLAIPLIFGLTFIVLIWGIVQTWILNGGNEEAISKGKKLVVVGVAAFVLMFGIWGILAILRTTFFGV